MEIHYSSQLFEYQKVKLIYATTLGFCILAGKPKPLA
jgi:hypothetical protein